MHIIGSIYICCSAAHGFFYHACVLSNFHELILSPFRHECIMYLCKSKYVPLVKDKKSLHLSVVRIPLASYTIYRHVCYFGWLVQRCKYKSDKLKEERYGVYVIDHFSSGLVKETAKIHNLGYAYQLQHIKAIAISAEPLIPDKMAIGLQITNVVVLVRSNSEVIVTLAYLGDCLLTSCALRLHHITVY